MHERSPSRRSWFENLKDSTVFRLAALTTVGLLSACASGPQFSTAEPPKDGHAVLYIYRQLGVFGVAVQPDIFVDGQLVGHLPAGGYLRVEVSLPTGPRLAFIGGRSCMPLTTGRHRPSVMELVPGGTSYVELDFQVGSQPMGDRYVWKNTCRLQLADPDRAITALRNLKLAN